MSEIKQPKAVGFLPAGLTSEAQARAILDFVERLPALTPSERAKFNQTATPNEKAIFAVALGAKAFARHFEKREGKATPSPRSPEGEVLQAWLQTTGEWFASCQSMTLKEFAWLCAGVDPRKRPGTPLLVDSNKAYEIAYAGLSRCVELSLTALPPAGSISELRFDVAELVRTALAGHLGSSAWVNVRALLDYCVQRHRSCRALFGAEASNPDKYGNNSNNYVNTSGTDSNNFTKKTEIAREPGKGGKPEFGAAAGTNPDPNPVITGIVATNSRTDADNGTDSLNRIRKSKTRWHRALASVLANIELGGRALDPNFSCRRLPEGAKQLWSLVEAECLRSGIGLNRSPQTVLRLANSLGRHFDGAGQKASNGKLQEYAERGRQLKTPPPAGTKGQ